MEPYAYLLLYFLALGFTCQSHAADIDNTIIGAVFNCATRVGREQRVAAQIALEDLNRNQSTNFTLRVKCSGGDPLKAAQSSRYLILVKRAHIILAPNSWEESSAVTEAAAQFRIPVLSLSDDVPSWATIRWPYFIQASPSTFRQTEAVAAIIRSWEWDAANVIYEDSGSASSAYLNRLHEAFRNGSIQMNRLVAIPNFISDEALKAELFQLTQDPCRIYVVHVGPSLAQRVFQKAKELKMMERDYVWIITDSASSSMHSMSTSAIASMQGVVGVRRYVPETGESFHNFSTKFAEHFRMRFPEEKNHDPGIFALQAYDATYAGGLAMTNTSRILEGIEHIDMVGLSGKVQLKGRAMDPVDQFQIINVYGRSYRVDVGFWSAGRGFSKHIDSDAEYNTSMASLGQMFWPGGPLGVPKEWHPVTLPNPLVIGVPNGSLTKAFVNIEWNSAKNNYTFSGYSIEIFEKMVEKLKYQLEYRFVPFVGNYTDLVKQVHAKKFHAAVGDIAIISERYEYVDFTQPHTSSGMVMVVPVQSYPNKAWLFLKPFTKSMWLLTGLINVYNGFIIWIIERNFCPDQRSAPLLQQTGTFLWLAFGSSGERLHSNLSKMAAIVWLFMALIITQSYTASLSSMLTVPRIEPKITNVETLISKKALVGCSERSFVRTYLESVLQINAKYIKNFTETKKYAEALRNGEISAAFLELPVAKLFVARYCKSFTIVYPPYKVGGYGFAFPKGSPLIPDVNKALLEVFETGAQKDLEKNLIASEQCVDLQGDNNTMSLSPHSFAVLFIFSGGTSTTALVIYYFGRKMGGDGSNAMGEGRGAWIFISTLVKKWKCRRNKFSRKVSDVECVSVPNRLSNLHGHEVVSMPS